MPSAPLALCLPQLRAVSAVSAVSFCAPLCLGIWIWQIGSQSAFRQTKCRIRAEKHPPGNILLNLSCAFGHVVWLDKNPNLWLHNLLPVNPGPTGLSCSSTSQSHSFSTKPVRHSNRLYCVSFSWTSRFSVRAVATSICPPVCMFRLPGSQPCLISGPCGSPTIYINSMR